MAEHQRIHSAQKEKNKTRQPSPVPQQDIHTPEDQTINLDTLTPDVIQRLQRTHGNQFVQRLIMRSQAASSQPREGTPALISTGRKKQIQRVTSGRSLTGDDVEEGIGNTNDLVGHVGDWLGTDPSKGLAVSESQQVGYGDARTGMGQDKLGGSISVITGTVGTGMGIYKTGKSGMEWHEAEQELRDTQERVRNGEAGLFATVQLLERKKAAAQKGTAEGVGSILGGISGFINGVAGLASAAVVAGVAFGCGQALNVLIGTINAIRDFMNVAKRSKAKSAISKVLSAYTQLADDQATKVEDKKNEIDQLASQEKALDKQLASYRQKRNNAKSQKAKSRYQTKVDEIKDQKRDLNNQLQTLANELARIEGDFDKFDSMRQSLATSKRKQGFGSKIFSGLTNLVGVGGSAALLAATIGGVGAAAGPVGWVLGGIALVAMLSFFIGREIKQSIRKSNVTRMQTELPFVEEYITTGKVGGVDKTTETNPLVRETHPWTRDMFTEAGVPKKGWFNKLISKKKSGTLTMGERRAELKEYLGKYDKDAAANTVWEGFKRALTTAEGDLEVDNPAFDQKLKDAVDNGTRTDVQPDDTRLKPKITLKEQIENLIAHFFGKNKVAQFVEAINAGGTKEQDARTLILQKMKLVDK